jgi:hypothetical protein
MSSEDEEIIRRAYQRPEDKDIEAFIAAGPGAGAGG